MMPSMRSVWIVVAICGLFFSCLAAGGCGPSIDGDDSGLLVTCEDVAQEMCDRAIECSIMEPEHWPICHSEVLSICNRTSPAEFTTTCEAIQNGTWGPERN